MASQEIKNPKNPTNLSKRSSSSPPSVPKDGFLSPRFRSAAAMAGWDEEALLLASLVVEDTPVRESRHKKRPNDQHFKSPAATTSSNSKRRSKRQPPDSVPVVVLCLDEEEEVVKKDVGEKKREVVDVVVVEDGENKMKGGGESTENASSNNKGLPCMDRLREELSCAICLEICFEPSTTPCGHSFCKKCLKCAATKCGKRCPKCRHLISNGRSCTVNTVLWNTIQLLFPDEIEARRKAASTSSHSANAQSRSPPESGNHGVRINSTQNQGVRISSTRSIPRINSTQNQGVRINSTRSIPRSTSFITTATQVSQEMERDWNAISRRRPSSTQTEDAALALRLQREEFTGAFNEPGEQQPRRTTLLSARANLRAMASRAYHIRTRGRYQ